MSYAVTAIVKVTDQCNLNCPYCYYYAGSAIDLRRRKFRDAELRLQSLASKLISSSYINGASRASVVLHGGEPLLVPKEVLEKFVAPLRRHFGRALKFSVQTNGVLVDESWIQFFAQYEMSASVSLDGPREIHDANRPKANGSGSYDAAVAAIHKLQGAALKGQLVSPGVLAVFSPEITGEVYFDSIVRDLGVKSFDLLFPDHAYADPSTLAEVIARYSAAVDAIWRRWLAEDDPSIDIRFITQSLHAVARGAPLFNPDVQRPIVIDLNGDIFIEDGLRASVDYHDLKLGNWRDEVFDDLMKVVEAAGRRSASTPDGCENCANLARCRGGDITTRLQLEGGRYGRPPLCDVFQGGFTHAENVLKTVGARRAQSA